MGNRKLRLAGPVRCLAAAGLLIFSVGTHFAWAQDATPQAKKDVVDEKTIRKLIAELGDNSFEKREAASTQLAEVGEPALAQLKKAATESKDPEVRERVGQLIKGITATFFVQVRRFDMPVKENGKPWITRVTVTPDGKHVVATGYQALHCWDLATGKEGVAFEQANTRYSWSLACAPDGQRLITGSDDFVARVFDMKSGKLVSEFKGHTASIWGAALLADGKRAVTGAWDNSLRLWDVATGKEIRAFDVKEKVRCLVVSPDGKFIAAGHFSSDSSPAAIRFWDLETGKETRSLSGHTMPITSIGFSPDGKTLLTSGFDSKVSLWDVVTGKEVKSLTGHARRVESAAFTSDGSRVVSCGSQGDPTVCLWDAKSGSPLFQTAEVSGGFAYVAVVPGARQCVTGGRDGVVRLWQWKR